MKRFLSFLVLTGAALAALVAPGANAAGAAACVARSGDHVPVVVELYTSEGCSSCPPADRWLSGLAHRDGVVALAFHVDYWDSLGWKDRFAQAAFSRRQEAERRTDGARFSYTPQVVVDGRDTPGWSAWPPASPAVRPHADLALKLERDATGFALTVTPDSAAPRGGYVAVVDDGLRSDVAAGENRGETLREDGVVRELLPWSTAGARPTTLRLASTTVPEPGATRRWVAVAVDAASGRPSQAVSLACPR